MERKNRLIMQITLLLIPMLVVAQYDHISVFSHLNGDDLYEEIVDTYKPDVVLTYGMARDTMFSKIDGVNDSLECIYTGMKRYLIPGEDPTQAVYLDGAPNGINTEHSYPQSKGASDGNARRYMHHLYPSRSQTNNDRGSKVFDESNDFQTSIWYRNMTEQGNVPGSNIDEWSELGNNLFEPRESVKGDILKNVVLILSSRGENDKAIALMKEARLENPTDITLVRAEAEMVYKMGDIARYDELMQQVLAFDPTDPEPYYNIGVVAAASGNPVKAMEFYKKAIELKPDYSSAQVNLGALILRDEMKIVDEMNSLGMSKADSKKYDALETKREGLYREALPYLEAAYASRGDNPQLIRKLMEIYSQLSMDAKFSEMKSKLSELEN